MDGDGKRLGRALLALRRQFGYSQEELAEKAGLVPSYISRFENGQYESPAYSTLNKIARAFGMLDAGVLMRRMELVDHSAHGTDAEVSRIREMAQSLEQELLLVPDSERAAALAEAIRVLRAGVRRTGSVRGNHRPVLAGH